MTIKEFLKSTDLNKNQLNAATHKDGPLLIIAGPGSGKTKTLVERVIYLILSGVKPENIMVSTFTEKAAKELITRISNRLIALDITVNLNELYIGTLHSIFLRILEEFREYTRLKRNYRLLDDFDQLYIVYKNFDKYVEVADSALLINNLFPKRWDCARDIIKYVSKVAEECVNIGALKKAPEREIRVIGEFHDLYMQQILEENALDFSTIQTELLHLLENKSILKKLHEKIQYVMIDEYQDTNTIQEKILFKLAGKSQNLCVVGDDDQGLYRFRGATIRNILEFPTKFKTVKCKIEKLTTNYRSHPDIIKFYNHWMDRDEWSDGSRRYRYDKTIQPSDGNFPDIPTVVKVGCEGENSDYFKEVLAFIRQLEKKKVITDYNQIAFLFKSVKNDNVIQLANFLENNGIKVFSPRSALFFERDEIKLILGALIFIFPTLFEDLKWKDDAHLDVWDYYQECKDFFAEALRKDKARNKELLAWCQRRAKEHLTLNKSANYAFAALLYQMLEYPMFADYLNVDMNANKVNLRSAYNIGQLSNLLFKFEYIYNITVLTQKNIKSTLKNLFNIYIKYLVDGGLEEYEDFDEYAPSGCVSFMTIHQSKGLEFPIVFVGSLNLNPTKSYKDIDEVLQTKYFSKRPYEPLEDTKFFDFWRLFYTAFSRPQNLLVLTAREQTGRGPSPSKHFRPYYDPLPTWRDKRFKLEKLKLATVKPVNLKKEYSFTSHILLYENCPLQYKFYKELQFTEVRTGSVIGGSLLHQTIEDIHKAVLREESHTLSDENIRSWFESNYYLLSKSQRSYLHEAQRAALLTQVLRYRDANTNKWHLIQQAEVDVSLVKPNYILKGKIDLIKGENDTVELLDFKSGDKPDVDTTEQKQKQLLNQYRRQLEVYAHLVEERTGKKVSKMHLYYPKEENSSPLITFRADKVNIKETVKTFDTIVNKIAVKDYDMSDTPKSEKQCGNCDMRFHCNPKKYRDR